MPAGGAVVFDEGLRNLGQEMGTGAGLASSLGAEVQSLAQDMGAGAGAAESLSTALQGIDSARPAIEGIRKDLQDLREEAKTASAPVAKGGAQGGLLGIMPEDAEREARVTQLLQDAAERRRQVIQSGAANDRAAIRGAQTMTEAEISEYVATVQGKTEEEIRAWQQATDQKKGATRDWSQASEIDLGQIDALSRGLTSLDSLARLAGVGGIAYLAKRALGAAVDLGTLGAAVERIDDSFMGLAADAGLAGDGVLHAMHVATAGTVQDTALMLDANRGLILGLQATEKEWGELAYGARMRARALGADTADYLERTVEGITRGFPRSLLTLGYSGVRDALNQYGEDMDVAISKMTESQRQEVLLNAVLEDTRRKFGEVGDVAVDNADKIDRFHASQQMLKQSAGELFAGPVGGIAQWGAESMDLVRITGDLTKALFDGKVSFGDFVVAGNTAKQLVFREGSDEAEAYIRAVIAAGHAVDWYGPAAERAGDESTKWYVANLRLDQSLVDVDAEVAAANTLVREFAQGVVDAIGPTLEFGNALLQIQGIAGDLGAISGDELVKGFESGAGKLDSSLLGLVGTAPTGLLQGLQSAYVQELEAFYTSVDNAISNGAHMTEFQIEAGARAIYDKYQARADVIEQAAKDETKTIQDAERQRQQAMGGLDTALLGLVGQADRGRIEGIRSAYLAEMGAFYDRVRELHEAGTDMSAWEIEYQTQVITERYQGQIDAIEQSGRDREKAIKDAQKKAEQAMEDLRGTIRSALQPTQVTALDMGMTAIGQYADQWDEDARRLDAIAARGFAELKIHPDWAGMLKIPENVLQAGEEALKSWATQTSDKVRNLYRPDLLVDNMDAIVNKVQEYLRDQAAAELSLDLITKAVVERGLVSGEDAKQQVAQALGLETALPVSLSLPDDAKSQFVESLGPLQVPVSLTAAEPAAEGKSPGASMAGDLLGSFWGELEAVSWTQRIVADWTADFKENSSAVEQFGALIGLKLRGAMLDNVVSGDLLGMIIAAVLSAMADAAEER